MSIDRKLKRIKEREEREKLRREAGQRAANAEKAREYYQIMAQAYNSQDFATALQWALKLLKIPPLDKKVLDVAIYCANRLGEDKTLYGLLKQSWQNGLLREAQNHLVLGHMAMKREELEFARDVFKKVVQEHREIFLWIPKKQVREASRYLLECEARLNRARLTKALDKEAASSRREEQARASVKPAQKEADSGRQPVPEEQLPQLKIAFQLDQTPLLQAIEKHSRSDYEKYQLALEGYRLSFRSSYDQLICLAGLRNVRSLWYQEETARKVMRTFRGRAILADEVGLGKTIEAGLILKEYVLRGLVRSALILTPSSLVHQWQEEMADKFGLAFSSSNDPLCRQDPESFWGQPNIIASIHTAKTSRHFDSVTKRSYDMVIVDEAHHLKNRTTLNWKLVNSIQKTFLLMLTATPVQNSLEELYNLVTLLRPGHLKTLNAFKEEYVTPGNPTDPQNREKLKTLLKEVMVRNTRSVTQLQLPPRFAYTIRIAPTPEEEQFYGRISQLVIDQSSRLKGPALLRLRKLLEAAGSSHAAALRLLENTAADSWNGAGKAVAEIMAVGKKIAPGNKTLRVIELLRASPSKRSCSSITPPLSITCGGSWKRKRSSTCCSTAVSARRKSRPPSRPSSTAARCCWPPARGGRASTCSSARP